MGIGWGCSRITNAGALHFDAYLASKEVRNFGQIAATFIDM